MKIAFVFTGTWVFFFAAEIWSWSSAVDCQYPVGCSGCLHLLVDIYVLGSDHKDSSYQTQPGETLPVPPLHKHSYLCSFGWAHFFSFCGEFLMTFFLSPCSSTLFPSMTCTSFTHFFPFQPPSHLCCSPISLPFPPPLFHFPCLLALLPSFLPTACTSTLRLPPSSSLHTFCTPTL